MKRLLVALCLVGLLITHPSAAVAAGPVVIQIDGVVRLFDTPPMVVEGTTLVPLRGIFEALGAGITWDGATQTITAAKGSRRIRLRIGEATALVNGRVVPLAQKAQIIAGRTMVPLRFVSEALGADVQWDGATNRVTITSGLTITPEVTAGVLHDIVSVSSNGWHTLALDKDGAVWAWGSNSYGEIGDGTRTNQWLPVKLAGLTGVTAVSAGGFGSLAVLQDGTVLEWGATGSGYGVEDPEAAQTVPTPVPGLRDVIAVSAGTPNLAMKADGSVWLWGTHRTGHQAVRLNLHGVTEISSGSPSLAVLSDGTVWSIDDQGRVDPVPGLADVVSVAAGSFTSYALKRDGTVWSWERSWMPGETRQSEPVQVQGLTNVFSVVAGAYDALALKQDGTVWEWGSNLFGELHGTEENYYTPVREDALAGVTALAAGAFHSLALKDGQLIAWGDNQDGQLGNGTTDKVEEMVMVGDNQGPALLPEDLLTYLQQKYGVMDVAGEEIPVRWTEDVNPETGAFTYTAVLTKEAWAQALKLINGSSGSSVKDYFRRAADVVGKVRQSDPNLTVLLTLKDTFSVKPDRQYMDLVRPAAGGWYIEDDVIKYVREDGQEARYTWHHY